MQREQEMDQQLESPPPRQRPLEKHARIESDLFCDHCHYNLYTQPVTRDERLGILVVRCPECGRFQPAAVASNAGRIWLLRLGAIAVAVWSVFLMAILFWGGFGLLGLQVATIESLTMGRNYDAQGRALYRSWDSKAQKTIWYTYDTDELVNLQGEPTYRRSFRPMKEVFEIPVASAVVIGLMMLAPTVFGGVLAVLMWHVPLKRLILALVLPLLAAGIVSLVFYVDEYERGGHVGLIVKLVFAAAAAEMILMFLGMNIGRPIARFFATYFIPPRPRQAIAFLWTIDNKPPPAL